MNKQNSNHLYADGEYNREQLHNILTAAGYVVTDDTFRNLKPKENGQIAEATFRITENNELVSLTKEQIEEALFNSKFTRLADVLAERFLHDIEVTDVNPWTDETERGLGYVKASIMGMSLPYKEFGGQMFQSYVQGMMTEKDIAARMYYPKMLGMHEALLRRTIKEQTMDKLVTAARTQTQQAENDKPMRVIYVHQPIHKDQLRAMMAACGFETTPDTFRNLVKDGNGTYSNTTFSVIDNKAMVLDNKDTDMYMFHPAREHIHEALAPHVITEAAVTKINPETGLAADEGCAFLCCKLFGQKTTPLQIGSSLLRLYERGQIGTVQLAGGMYRNALIDHYQEVKTEVDCGYRWTDGYITRYYTGHTGEGEIYKDMKAFDEKEGICYLSGHALECYESDKEQGVSKPIEHYGDTYKDLVHYARMNALRNPVKVARYCLQNCTWQSPTTELDEFQHNCDVEDILELDEQIQDTYDLFIEDCGKAPNYADVYIIYKDGGGQRDTIALNPKAGEQDDESVVFTCQNFEEFKKLADNNNKEDFYVAEIYGYYYGDRDHELKAAMQEKSYSANPVVSSPINENDIDTMDAGATLITSEEKEIPWYKDLSRISDVNVFRNPMNKDYVEFRMRCKIDGEQMLGRVITTQQVEDLANGADRKEIAAQVFAREMTLNNPNEQSIKNGLGK